MKCVECQEMISSEVDGELEEMQSLPVMRHLVVCNDCRDEYNALSALKALIREDYLGMQVDVPVGFAGRVMDAVAAESETTYAAERDEGRPSLLDLLGSIFPAPKQVLSWSLAASVLIVLTYALYDYGPPAGPVAKSGLTNARAIDAKVLKAEKENARVDGEDEFYYYVKQHARALQHKADRSSIGSRKSNVVYASFNSNTGGMR